MKIGEKKKRIVIRKLPLKPGEVIPVEIPQPIKLPQQEPAVVPAVPKEVPRVGSVGN